MKPGQITEPGLYRFTRVNLDDHSLRSWIVGNVIEISRHEDNTMWTVEPFPIRLSDLSDENELEHAMLADTARALNSREIAKIISATLGGFVSWCDPREVMEALDHLADKKEKYKTYFYDLSMMANAAEKGDRLRAIGLSHTKVLQFLLITMASCVRDIGPKGMCDLVFKLADHEKELFELFCEVAQLENTSQIQPLIEIYSSKILTNAE